MAFHIRIVCLFCAFFQCYCSGQQEDKSCNTKPSEHLSLLQTKADAVARSHLPLGDEPVSGSESIERRSTSLLQFFGKRVKYDYLVPPPSKEKPKDVLCQLKMALVNATEFTPVRQGQSLEQPQGDRKCAVVSSSGVLNLHNYGHSIDNASLVIRFNTAPTEGFEQIVGKNEGWRIVNEKVVHEFLGDEDFGHRHEAPVQERQMTPGPDYLLTCSICGVGEKKIMDMDQFKSLQQSASEHGPHLKLFASDLSLERSFFKYLYSDYGLQFTSPAGPTTGAIGMLIALSHCDEVVAYGMGDSMNTEEASYHYYEPEVKSMKKSQTDQTREWHRSFDSEKDLWRRLAINSLYEINYEDKIVIPGFNKVSCNGEKHSMWDKIFR